MLRSLGIYVDRNLIKYAKVKRNKNSYKVETFNVETCENITNYEELEKALIKIITETGSTNIPICINVSDESYDYFDIYNGLEKSDIEKSLKIEFNKVCEKYDENPEVFESRYMILDDSENIEKNKSIYISMPKEILEKDIEILSKYKLYSISPEMISIVNLLDKNIQKNVIVLNIENETKCTTIIDGKISRVDILGYSLGNVIEEIDKKEMSLKKAYEAFKSITVYDKNSLDLSEENEYEDIILKSINEIIKEVKEFIELQDVKMDEIYISGTGAVINNIDLYFQENININCKILKPFFIDATSVKNPIQEYIEVNSAIALALDGIGFLNKDLNFAPISKFNNLEIDTKVDVEEEFDIKNWKLLFKTPLNIKEKVLARLIFVLCALIIVFSVFSNKIMKKINLETTDLENVLAQNNNEIKKIDDEISKIDKYNIEYENVMNSTSEEDVKINKDSIPNFLIKLMYIIPKNVQVKSIENVDENSFQIKVISDKYEQIEQFVNSLEAEGLLTNIETSKTENNSEVEVVIKGNLI